MSTAVKIAALAAAAAATAPLARASEISINVWGDSSLSAAFVGSSGYTSSPTLDQSYTGNGQTAGAPGAATSSDWNNIYVGPSVATNETFGTLVTDSGTTAKLSGSNTAVALAYQYSGQNANGYGAAKNWTSSTTGDQALYYNNVRSGGAGAPTVTATITNVPYATYNIYVYADANSGTWNIYDNHGSSYYFLGDLVSGAMTVNTGYTQGTATTSGSATDADYFVFPETTSSAIISLPSQSSGNIALFGIQIVDTTPEPASLALAGIGAAGLLLRRRGRRSAG